MKYAPQIPAIINQTEKKILKRKESIIMENTKPTAN